MGPFQSSGVLKQAPPSTSVVLENAAVLFCCKAPKMFCGLQKLHLISICRWGTNQWQIFLFWVNFSFKLQYRKYPQSSLLSNTIVKELDAAVMCRSVVSVRMTAHMSVHVCTSVCSSINQSCWQGHSSDVETRLFTSAYCRLLMASDWLRTLSIHLPWWRSGDGLRN